MAKQDYYETLGISKSATASEIKKAYRKMAIKYHPDKNPDDASAEAKFKEAAEAYEILSDDNKKARYDQYGHQAFEGGGGFGGGGVTGGGGGGGDRIRFAAGSHLFGEEWTCFVLGDGILGRCCEDDVSIVSMISAKSVSQRRLVFIGDISCVMSGGGGCSNTFVVHQF